MEPTGEWYVEKNFVRVKHPDGGWLLIATVSGGDSVFIPHAKLISAAPALLEACKLLLKADIYADAEGLVSFDFPATSTGILAAQKAKAAIKAAEGD